MKTTITNKGVTMTETKMTMKEFMQKYPVQDKVLVDEKIDFEIDANYFSGLEFQSRWKIAMNWWHSSQYECMIRNVANNSLARDYAGSGQGISSSDTNHSVFNIFENWIMSNLPEENFLSFLVDYGR